VSPKLLLLSIGCLGASAFMTQVTLMRELLSTFAGNELVIGIVLGSWMLLTGLGAALGRRAPRRGDPWDLFLAGQMLIAGLPIAAVFALRTLWDLIFVRGAAAGMPETVATSLVLLAPYCLLMGYLLTLACLLAGAEGGPENIARVYYCDSLGGIAGGAAFTLVLVWWLDHFSILYFPALLNLAAAGLLAWRLRRRRLLIAALAAGAALVALAASVDLDQLSTRRQYPGQEVVYRGNSPYGRLVVTRHAGQYNFLENGGVLFSTRNVADLEETVHYPMCQRPDARRVLLLCGGISGTAREILNYGVSRVDYVELDPLILRVAGQLVPQSLADPRIHVIPSDGRRFLQQPGEPYDVVIVDTPEPSTFQLNRFYTREFMRAVAGRLRPGGVLSFSLGSYDDYVGPEQAQLLASAYRTARAAFAHVLMIPGGRIFFLASDGPLTTAIAARIQSRGLATRVVNRHWLQGMITPDRLADLRRAVGEEAPLNLDFSPTLYYRHLLFWMTEFKVRFGLLEGGLLAVLALYLARIRPVPLAVFTTGFAAAALQVVLWMGFQILEGSTYQQVGLMVTMFMAGLAIGSWLMGRWLPRGTRRGLVVLQLAIAAVALGVPPLLWGLGHSGGTSAARWAAIALATIVMAVLVGMEFPLAGKVDFRSITATASRLYTADYVGAALGALLVSTLLIPLAGLAAACHLAAGLNILSAVVLAATGRGK
jgi:spermidine synthase